MTRAPDHNHPARTLRRAGRRAALYGIASGMLVALAIAAPIKACPAVAPSTTEPLRLLIEFRTAPDATAIAELAARHGLALIKRLPVSGLAVFRTESSLAADALLESLRREPLVKHVEVDRVRSIKEEP